MKLSEFAIFDDNFSDVKYTIRKAWQILENAAPFDSDCGKACDSRCCKGDEHIGMLLLPEEDELLTDLGCDFLTFGKTEDDDTYAVCSGECERALRPFACRIYPLFALPFIDDNGDVISIKIIKDPRAESVCPIAAADLKVNRQFEKAVRRAVRMLLTNPKLRDAYANMTQQIWEIKSFKEELCQSQEEQETF